jgi:hypothetical protein
MVDISTREVSARVTYTHCSAFLHHEYDGSGSHRLVLEDRKNNRTVMGEWATYTGLCHLKVDTESFEGATEYYNGEERVSIVRDLNLYERTFSKRVSEFLCL